MTKTLAMQLLTAFDQGQQIEPLSRAQPDISIADGYAIAAEIHRARLARGEQVAGRKIGFTNPKIWDIFNVRAPMWGWMYAASTKQIPAHGRLTLPALPECRIEPEIAFHFCKSPMAQMDDAALAACIDKVAHGFEIVWSAYPGWRFAAPDSIAAFGMHAAFHYGSPMDAGPLLADRAAALSQTTLTLTGPDCSLTGQGTDVLGGPLLALRSLIAEISAMPDAGPIQPGEWITTGTLTDAPLVARGQTWQTRLVGSALPGIEVQLI